MKRYAPPSDRLLADEQPASSLPALARLRVALVYPGSYSQGMSNLGFQGLLQALRQQPGCHCERLFWPEPDQLAWHEKSGQPLRSFEQQRPLSDFDLIAFSLSFENDYLHLPRLFALMRLPLWAKERDSRQPLVLAGGICCLMNPAPVAPFFDALAIGEGEVLLPPLLHLLEQPLSRPELLQRLAATAGYYVPALPPAVAVERQWLTDLDASDCRSHIRTTHTAFGDMHLVEVSRGCARGCRFCATGFVYLPARAKSPQRVCAQAQEALEQDRCIGLVGASVSDYPQLAELTTSIGAAGGRYSLASLRIDSLDVAQVRHLKDSGQKTLALAPEAGSQRLRDVINKHLSEEQILAAVALLAREGIENLKLYFLIGLPTETAADIEEMIALLQRVCALWQQLQRPRGHLGTIILSVNPFVPKAQTPFQWHAMMTPAQLKKQLEPLRRFVGRQANLQLQVESLRAAELQAFLSRADQGAAAAIVDLAAGTNLKTACRTHAIDLTTLLYQNRAYDDPLPWDRIASGVRKDYLWREYQHALAGQSTPTCFDGCQGCGVCAVPSSRSR
ncbi:radical SAM protein [Desulfuromonas thiophila]|uniref:radical SAM protein n=1 Tax=Desulfuromonas thiophila TaxID=57664 RepID=UPI0029F48944|nr:radical SAM protein [Desulfuromonas thiophila]